MWALKGNSVCPQSYSEGYFRRDLNTLALTSLLTFATTCLHPGASLRLSSPSQSLSIQAEEPLRSVLTLHRPCLTLPGVLPPLCANIHTTKFTSYAATSQPFLVWIYSPAPTLSLVYKSLLDIHSQSLPSCCWPLIPQNNLGNHDLKPAYIHRTWSPLPHGLDYKRAQICLLFLVTGVSTVLSII